MKRFRIIAYIDGVCHTKVVKANNKDEALNVAWSLFDADSVWVSEVKDDDRRKAD